MTTTTVYEDDVDDDFTLQSVSVNPPPMERANMPHSLSFPNHMMGSCHRDCCADLIPNLSARTPTVSTSGARPGGGECGLTCSHTQQSVAILSGIPNSNTGNRQGQSRQAISNPDDAGEEALERQQIVSTASSATIKGCDVPPLTVCLPCCLLCVSVGARQSNRPK